MKTDRIDPKLPFELIDGVVVDQIPARMEYQRFPGTSMSGPEGDRYDSALARENPKLIGVHAADFRRLEDTPRGPHLVALGAPAANAVARALARAGVDLLAPARDGSRVGTQELFRPGHERVLAEYESILNWVSTLTPDRKVGGLLNEKDLGDGLSILWKTDSDHTTLRFFQERGRHDYFDVTYHETPHIVDGRTVVRRFIGYPRVWRADTYDANTREYLGRQGADSLVLQPKDRQTLDTYRLGTPAT